MSNVEIHTNANCRYEKVGGSLAGKECYRLARLCECGLYKSANSSDESSLESDGISVHFNKNCDYKQKKHPGNKFVLTKTCFCKAETD